MIRAPRIEANGVPFCSRSDCPSYDGKHCEQTGFMPDVLCGPEVAAMTTEIERLRARDTEWQRVTQHSDPDAFLMAVCGGAPTTTAPLAPRAQWVSRGLRCAPSVDAAPSREPNDAGGGP